MKTFLDGLGFAFHRPRFHGKAFTSIVVQGICGGDDRDHAYSRDRGGFDSDCS